VGYQVQAHVAIGAFAPCKRQGGAVASGSSAQDTRFCCQMTMGFFIFFAILTSPNTWIVTDVIAMCREKL